MIGDIDSLRAILFEIRSFCLSNSAPSLTGRYAHCFKEGYDPNGVAQEAGQPQVEAWLSTYSEQTRLSGCLDLGDLLVEELGTAADLAVRDREDDSGATRAIPAPEVEQPVLMVETRQPRQP